jgi:Fuc2NAc and GlcNAc transferase
MIFGLAAGLSALLTALVRRHALATSMLDIPNARSSHAHATPRGGGLGIVLVLIPGIVALWIRDAVVVTVLIACVVGGAMVAAVGYLDDRRGLPALPRLLVHVAAVGIAMILLLPSPLSGSVALAQVMAYGVLAVGAIWSINLFNFMDGIDGIAASQAAFMSGAMAILVGDVGGDSAWSSLCALTAGGSVGFLLWNWPPARIFMGDVGSGFLGFWIAIMAIALHLSGVLSIWTSITLGSIFLADATTTLFRRVLSGQRWYEAHRTHAYQILARKWSSHRKVTVLTWWINLLVVLPLAYASTVWTDVAMLIALGLVTSLGAVCFAIGAGRS